MRPLDFSPACVVFLLLLLGSSSGSRECGLNLTALEPCSFETVLSVSYGKCGITFNSGDTLDEPTVTMSNAKSGTNYTLLMVDPDAPTRQNPSLAYWIYWAVVGMEGSQLLIGKQADEKISGTEVRPYSMPASSKGAHRIQFLVFKQPPGFTEKDMPSGFIGVDLQDFIESKGLCNNLVGAYQYILSSVLSVVTPSDGQVTISESDGLNRSSTCTVDLYFFDPCSHTNVLEVSHAVCDALLSTADSLSSPPSVTMRNAEANDLNYILFMVDPDVSTDGTAYHIHWIVYNISEMKLASGSIVGITVLEYLKPKSFSEVHRFMFLLFEQPTPFDPTDLMYMDRENFDMQSFIENNQYCSKLRGAHQYKLAAIKEEPKFAPYEEAEWDDATVKHPSTYASDEQEGVALKIKDRAERLRVQSGLMLLLMLMLMVVFSSLLHGSVLAWQ